MTRRTEVDLCAGWADGFAAMATEGEEEPPISGRNQLDQEEWAW